MDSNKEHFNKLEVFVSLPKEVQENYKRAVEIIKQTPWVEYFCPIEKAKLTFHNINSNLELLKIALTPYNEGSWSRALTNASHISERRGEELGRHEAFLKSYGFIWNICDDSWNRIKEDIKMKMKTGVGEIPRREKCRLLIVESESFRRSAATAAINFANFELISDQEGFKNNPFRYLIALFQSGFIPMGFQKELEKKKIIERFKAAIPLLIDEQPLMGFFKEGSEDIFFDNNCFYPQNKLKSA